MQRTILASKIHRAVVTDGHVDYEGSLTIDEALMEAAGLRPYEKIVVGNQANGERFETYAIAGVRGSGCICLNGATAHLGKKGDRLTIMSFALMTEEERQKHVPKVIVLNDQNHVVRSS